MENQQNNFLIYSTPNNNVRVDVFVQDETVWLTQKSLAKLPEDATCKEIL